MALLKLLRDQETAVSELADRLDAIDADFDFDFEIIVEELDDIFFVPSERAEELDRALSRLDAIRLPKAIPVQGRWSDLLTGVDRWQQTAEAKHRLEEVLQSRIDLVASYRLALEKLDGLHEKVTGLSKAVQTEAEKMVNRNNGERSFVVRFVDLFTNHLTFNGNEALDAIVEGLDDRASQIEILRRYAIEAIRSTEQDIKELQDSIEILQFMGPDVAPDTSGVEDDPERLFHRRASLIARNQSEIARQTAEAIRARNELLDKAAQQARRDSALARWQQILSLASSLGSLAQAIRAATPGDMVEVNGKKWPVPADVIERARAGLKLDVIMQLSGENVYEVSARSIWIGKD